MAVIQISKIQHRRGKKNSDVGIPQLSAAEFAWAIDTQELYIGNGSIADGAPYVGNTKVLTEHDNILELASSYRYAENDVGISLSVPRSLQSKLDEYVSVFDFGAVPDGSTDCTDAFETAFAELFKNSDSKFKKTLLVPNGIYLFTQNLVIPSTAKIRGETQEGVILNFDTSNILLETEDSKGVAEFTSGNRPEKIEVSNLTISRSTGQFDITGLTSGKFESVKFLGEYQTGDSVADIESASSALYWENTLDGTKVTDISFINCHFESNIVSLRCSQTAIFETEVTVDGCTFRENHTAILITGVEDQTNTWRITHTTFNEMFHHAFYSENGVGTTIDSCKFINSGNEGNNSSSTPATAIVEFGQFENNVISNCSTDRIQNGAITKPSSTVAIGAIKNSSRSSFGNANFLDISLSDSFTPLVALSADNRYTFIDYTLLIGDESRQGRLTMIIDAVKSTVSTSDDYSYTGGTVMTGFILRAEILDNNTDSIPETLLVTYKNPNLTGAVGTLTFFVTYGV